MAGYDGQVTEDLNKSQGIDVHDNRVKAKEVIDKVKAVILASKPNKTQEKLALGTILSHLDDIYEIFVEQAIELAVALSEIETLSLHVAEKHLCMASYADATLLSSRRAKYEQRENYASRRE